jgi:hypothetical protein
MLLPLLSDVQYVNQLLNHSLGVHSVNDVTQTDTIFKDPYNKWSFSPIYEDSPLNADNSCNALQPLFFTCIHQQVLGKNKNKMKYWIVLMLNVIIIIDRPNKKYNQ